MIIDQAAALRWLWQCLSRFNKSWIDGTTCHRNREAPLQTEGGGRCRPELIGFHVWMFSNVLDVAAPNECQCSLMWGRLLG